MPNVGFRIILKDGISYLFDINRSKILSIDRFHLRAGRKYPKVTNQYLRLEDRQPNVTVGDVLPRPATIVGLRANCETPATWSLQIFKRGNTGVLTSLSLASTTQAVNNSLNIDLDAGDILLLKVNGSNVPYPRGMVELAWRL